jgi:hypothetical protein
MGQMKTIGIFIPYFGPLPRWFPLFLKSCQFNPTIKFHLFTDEPPMETPSNVLVSKMTREQFRQLASERLSMMVNMSAERKVCDIRPAFGEIFDVSGLDFWGWGDLDVVYGDLRKFLTDSMLDDFDVISIAKEFICGPFSIFRNTNWINGLYRRSADFERVMTNEKHFSFDEMGPDVTWDKCGNFLIGDEKFESFTDVVLTAWRKHELRAHFGLDYYNDPSFSRTAKGDVVWKNGRLNGECGIEFLLYHFQYGKTWFNSWFIPNEDEWTSGFKICQNGFHPNKAT